MKNISKISVAALLFFSSAVAEEEDPKLDGFYLGLGAHTNYDHANVYVREDATFQNGLTVKSGTKIRKQTDFNYGVHALFGGNYIFSSNILVGLEEQIGVQHHPSKVESTVPDNKDKFRFQVARGWDFITITKLGYKFSSFPGVAYISGGIHIFNVDAQENSKSVCRPVFGIGYQHGLSKNWSIRGDVLYTHISSVKYQTKLQSGDMFGMKGKGYRISTRVTLVYTF